MVFESHLVPVRCDSSLPRRRTYAKNRGRGAPGFVLKGAIHIAETILAIKIHGLPIFKGSPTYHIVGV